MTLLGVCIASPKRGPDGWIPPSPVRLLKLSASEGMTRVMPHPLRLQTLFHTGTAIRSSAVPNRI
jgi:hypothetical protein